MESKEFVRRTRIDAPPERVFAYRHATTAADIDAHDDLGTLNVAVTGATGLVGSALVPFLTTGGHARGLPAAAPRKGDLDVVA